MKYIVEERAFEDVCQPLIKLMRRSRGQELPAERFEWGYARNPDGPAVLWTVREQQSGDLVGFTAALPRRVLVDGTIQRSWNCADFSIDPRHRALGAAIKLRRAATQDVDDGRVDLLYAHPNSRMQVVHDAVGHQALGRMVRMAKVLSSRAYLERWVPTKPLSAVAAAVADPILNRRGKQSYRPTSSTDVVTDVEFDERFDALFQAGASRFRAIGVRDARYLKWRYADNPLYDSHTVLAVRDSRLVGYAIFTVDAGVAHFKDLFTIGEYGITVDLVSALINACRSMGLDSISVVVLEGNPIQRVLADFGFVPRPESSWMYCHVPKGSRLEHAAYGCHNWYVTVGDRDV